MKEPFVHENHILKIRGICIGEDVPGIIVPVVETTGDAILEKANELALMDFDCVEWRADYYEALSDENAVKALLPALKTILNEKLLLFTVRTAAEGGGADVTDEAYFRLIKLAAETGCCDLIDVEMLKDPETVASCVDICHKYHTAVIGSNHDFHKTPPEEEILERLCLMRNEGADVLKTAYMPLSKADVLTLLSATEKAYRTIPDRPLITMSMGGTGAVSRITGEIFGSSMTFASVGKSSAPGQIPLKKLKTALNILHESL